MQKRHGRCLRCNCHTEAFGDSYGGGEDADRFGLDVSFDADCFGFDAARTGRFSLDAGRFGFDIGLDAT